MMTWFQGIVLGIVQGLTEFLPVSSSGHLILVPKLFAWSDQGLAFDTVLHGGTLIAVLWFFRADLVAILKGMISSDRPHRLRAQRLSLQIIVAALPGLVVGYLLHTFLEKYDRVAWLVALDLAVWALVLWWADRKAHVDGENTVDPLEPVSWKQSIVIGCAQVLALLPGTSRSGMTITAGLFLGLSRARAARFSFLLSIPVTAAAAGYGMLQWIREPLPQTNTLVLLAGFVASLLTGAWSIRFLLRFVSRHSYVPFVLYRLVLAALVVLLLVL